MSRMTLDSLGLTERELTEMSRSAARTYRIRRYVAGDDPVQAAHFMTTSAAAVLAQCCVLDGTINPFAVAPYLIAQDWLGQAHKLKGRSA